MKGTIPLALLVTCGAVGAMPNAFAETETEAPIPHVKPIPPVKDIPHVKPIKHVKPIGPAAVGSAHSAALASEQSGAAGRICATDARAVRCLRRPPAATWERRGFEQNCPNE